MPRASRYDAVVIGSGPNGLAAGIRLAQAGRRVLLVEARDTIGGGVRSAALTLPGFVHDVCSAIHGLGVSSPFFRSLPLAAHGLEWITPPAPLAHPLDDGSAVLIAQSLDATCEALGKDGAAYRRLFGPIVRDWERLLPDVLGPLPLPPQAPLPMLAFGARGLWPARWLAHAALRGPRARAAFAGMAAHSCLSLDDFLSAAFGIMLGVNAHVTGWPLARGGSQQFANALAAHFVSLGGEIVTGWDVRTLDELPPADAVLCDVTPRQLLRIAGERLPRAYAAQLTRFRYGPGVFKIDYALSAPIPWRAADCAQAGTVHLGGTFDEIAASEHAAAHGRIPDRPYVIVVQPTLFDPSRAPAGRHIAWAYCHVPHASSVDMTSAIEAQLERFAPGFGDCVLARATKNAPQMELWNANYVGGDINGGVQDIFQQYTRPAIRWNPYSTPLKGLYLCSSSTPPGGGAHGMCGWHAAESVLRA